MVSFLIFFVPTLVAFVVAADTGRVYIFQLGRQRPKRWCACVESNSELWTDILMCIRRLRRWALTNNIGVVATLAFAGSATAGLFVVYPLLIQRIEHRRRVRSAASAWHERPGLAEFVVAHASIELSVIFLAGGCGLYVGEAIIRPGLLSRKDALVQRARVAVSIVLGCVPLLVLAGIIEGFISPSGLPWIVKTAVGVGTGVALYWYWLRPPSSR
ncbi:MAG: stage II sporulation protein M [Caldilineaceae bacterium]